MGVAELEAGVGVVAVSVGHPRSTATGRERGGWLLLLLLVVVLVVLLVLLEPGLANKLGPGFVQRGLLVLLVLLALVLVLVLVLGL